MMSDRNAMKTPLNAIKRMSCRTLNWLALVCIVRSRFSRFFAKRSNFCWGNFCFSWRIPSINQHQPRYDQLALRISHV